MTATRPASPNETASERRLSPRAAAALRAAIALAGGREVCFAATLDGDGVVETARVVARGGVDSVLALPGFAERGEMLLHNHPSGRLDPSDAVRATLAPEGPVAARLARYEDRDSQRDMAAAIARLYNGGGIGLFEAGTG